MYFATSELKWIPSFTLASLADFCHHESLFPSQTTTIWMANVHSILGNPPDDTDCPAGLLDLLSWNLWWESLLIFWPMVQSCTWHLRAGYRFAPCQWEMSLLCNNISHWLGASLESALHLSKGLVVWRIKIEIFLQFNITNRHNPVKFLDITVIDLHHSHNIW